MTKYVSIIGNGESRRGFDISPLKMFSTVIGCNAIYRDYITEYLVCCDRHMCQQSLNAVGKNTTVYTRDRWIGEFAHWPNARELPPLPYSGDKRQDEPFHWGTGPYAGVLGLTFKPKAIFMIGFDLFPFEKDKVNNIYHNSEGYQYIKRPVDPSYWIYQNRKIFEHYPKQNFNFYVDQYFKIPEGWDEMSNVQILPISDIQKHIVI